MRMRKPRTKSGQTVMIVVPCPSFFNFFSPPYIPDGDGEVLVERVEDLLDEDYEVGVTNLPNGRGKWIVHSSIKC